MNVQSSDKWPTRKGMMHDEYTHAAEYWAERREMIQVWPDQTILPCSFLLREINGNSNLISRFLA